MQTSTEVSIEDLKDMLVSPGHITEKQFDEAIKAAQKKHVLLTHYLVQEGYITDKHLGETIANHYNCRYIDLSEVTPTAAELAYIPEVVARSQKALVFGEGDGVLKLATSLIDNYRFVSLLKKKTRKHIEVFYATSASIERALRLYKGDLHEKITELINRCQSNEGGNEVVLLVESILEYAFDSRASDIHIEPLEKNVLIRYRVDGILHEIIQYPTDLHEKVVLRLKILAHLQTDESAAAQDGRFDFTCEGTVLDVRISIMPVTDGENVVMRLLGSAEQLFTLQDIGLGERDYSKIIDAAKEPYGMILAVGPTGSGKTTALYAVLHELNKPQINIMTIEDPVEYDIDRVQQTQVNPKKDLTFSKGLRSIVRQDPDVIMVGEIRDEETADIAVNAAMTGHLLLSTLHTNDASTTFPRLIEMSIEPFLVASSVNVVIALRLVRKICKHCLSSYVPKKAERDLLQSNVQLTQTIQKVSGKDELSSLRLYKGTGCDACKQTGYSGRIGIFEVLDTNEHIRRLIAKKATAEEIDTAAKELGMTSMLHDGVTKALNGITTIDEVIKATRLQ